MIPAVIGYVKTKINYDILVYLPEDIETIKGQNILTNDFKTGAFSFVFVELSLLVELFLKKILMSKLGMALYVIEFSSKNNDILLKIIFPFSSKMKSLILNIKLLLPHFTFNFNWLITILMPFNAWFINLSIIESKKDFEGVLFVIFSIDDCIKESINFFLS